MITVWKFLHFLYERQQRRILKVQEVAEMLRANVIMTSAKTGEGIQEAFEQISRQLIEKEDTELYAISASNTLINLDQSKNKRNGGNSGLKNSKSFANLGNSKCCQTS